MNTNSVRRLRRGLGAAVVAAVALTGAVGIALPASAAPSTAPVAGGPTSLVAGQLASFTASVPKLANTVNATGKVKLLVDGQATSTEQLDKGKAKFDPVTLSVGSHQVTVSYAGDKKYAAATSAPLAVSVTRGATSTTIIAVDKTIKSGKAAYVGAAVVRKRPSTGGSLAGSLTFTATPTSGPPVAFVTPVDRRLGIAGWAPKLPDGTWTIKAVYAGNGDFTGSTSNTFSVKVGKGGTTPPPTDSDGDRLSNTVEISIGTDPNNADTDGDAISDGDEVLGTTAGLNLPAMGFSARHKDLAVEFDWYVDALECGSTHTHRPTPAAIDRLVAGYAGVGVTNPDGTTGIHVVADYGQGGAFTGGSVLTGDPSGLDDIGPAFYAVKATSFAANRNGIFHYVAMGHRFAGEEQFFGTGELLGDDVIVNDDCLGEETNVISGGLFHELGHNLGLRHGGNEDVNFKPNYNSTMNYRWGDGIDTNCDGIGDGTIGFSDGSRAPLDENALLEANGICGPGNPIDWNGNGTIEPGPIAFNINPDDGPDLTVLTDSNDLAQISFAGINDAD